MRRISMWCSIALAVAMVAPAVAEVTPEDLAEQAAVVAAAQSALDSLTSLSYAQSLAALADSNETLATAGVQIEIATPADLTGLRDPEYVDVDIPVAEWDAATRRLWSLELRESGVAAIFVAVGRYSVHRGNVPAFLALVETFIDGLAEEE